MTKLRKFLSRKGKLTERLTVSISVEMLDEIRQYAEYEDRHINGQIRWFLKRALEAERKTSKAVIRPYHERNRD